MNFFANKNKELVKKQLPIEPLSLYNSLNKSNEYLYLRGVQEEVLKLWHERRTEKDLLIKMNTGAGKTLTGLLMLYSKMLENSSPVVYICPDNQLVKQVIEQSLKYGIPTCEIDSENDFPEAFLNSEAILITNINKLFNGKNIFDRDKIQIESIVIDDAHKCVEKVVDSFTVKINSDTALYTELFDLFSDDLKQLAIGTFEAIRTKNPNFYLKVPYWSWIDKQVILNKILVKYIADKNLLLFKWKLIENNLAQYEMFINCDKIEISPMISFVDNIVAYKNVKNKYALSATFVNDHSLLSDLDFSANSITSAIEPKDRKDYGQRLVLAPKRYFNDISFEDHMEIITHHLQNGENVVVLVPSNRVAREWEKLGAVIIDKDSIDAAIDNLKQSVGNFVVFVNRYDGIDLSGNSCNVLIIYDHPKFKFIKDEYYQNIYHLTGGNIIAQTIEQGMGRSVRSGNDYSVIYLMGRHILKFLRHKENLKHFNKYTRRQLDLGLNLMDGQNIKSDQVVSFITGIADNCLNQDADWKEYYLNFMDGNNDGMEMNEQDKLLDIKHKEREAIKLFVLKDYEKAIQCLTDILKGLDSDVEKAWYLQLCANFAYPYNKNNSNDFQISSKKLNRGMLGPFLSKEKWNLQTTKDQIKKSVDFIKSFTIVNDLLLFIKDEILQNLEFDENIDAKLFEKSFYNLGRLLGYEASNPELESNEGCDILWICDDFSLVMEAKSQKQHKNLISKSDISQLLHSLTWFETKFIYSGECYGISIQANSKRDSNVSIPTNAKCIDLAKLNLLRESISKLSLFLSQRSIDNLKESELNVEFDKLYFTSKLFFSKYISNIK